MKKYIKKYLENNPGGYRGIVSKLSRKANNNLRELLVLETKNVDFLSPNVSQRIHYILSEIIPECEICGEITKYQNLSLGYRTFCSPTCAQKSGKTRKKIRITNNKKYGKDYFSQTEMGREITRKTNKEGKVGFGSEIFKRRIKEIYGVNNVSKSDLIKKKKVKTTLNNYGVENPFQSKEIKEKIKKTWLKKYGVDNPTLNDDIFYKTKISGFGWKDYFLPSGKKIKIQGYENLALDILLKKYKEEDILMGKEIRKKIGMIHYHFDSKERKYYPDIYIISENKIIEVKSIWVYNIKKKKNILKKKACLNLKLNFEFMVFDNNRVLTTEY